MVTQAQVENCGQAAKGLGRHTRQFGVWQAHIVPACLCLPWFKE